MKNLLMFFGSCGHTTVQEVDVDLWNRFAKDSRTRTGHKTRMVYVYPYRFCVCSDCAEREFMEGL